jgi:hypothetical protein
MNCCICGPVKNCGPYLNKVFQNIEKIGSLFDDYKILIYYDKSNDNTLQILKEYQKKNPKLYFYVNKTPFSKFRTHNIAIARNYCLNFVRNNKEKFPFFIMMDFDDVNCKNCKPEILEKYLKREDWDGLSFNTSPEYYDIWGLSIYPYCFSYNHFENNVKYYYIIQKYISALLKKVPQNGLLPCISAFNGFSIYKTNKFLNTYYDGRIRRDLIPLNNMLAHIRATNSKLVYKKYITSDCNYEDCEHRAFHIQARQNSNSRIMISPEVLFF